MEHHGSPPPRVDTVGLLPLERKDRWQTLETAARQRPMARGGGLTMRRTVRRLLNTEAERDTVDIASRRRLAAALGQRAAGLVYFGYGMISTDPTGLRGRTCLKGLIAWLEWTPFVVMTARSPTDHAESSRDRVAPRVAVT